MLFVSQPSAFALWFPKHQTHACRPHKAGRCLRPVSHGFRILPRRTPGPGFKFRTLPGPLAQRPGGLPCTAALTLCFLVRPVGCAPSWKPMGAPWVHRLRLLPQLGPPTLFNSLVGAHCPGRGCLGKCCDTDASAWPSGGHRQSGVEFREAWRGPERPKARWLMLSFKRVRQLRCLLSRPGLQVSPSIPRSLPVTGYGWLAYPSLHPKLYSPYDLP